MLLIAHTVKGWGLRCAAQSANHSAMLSLEEVNELRERAGLPDKVLTNFERLLSVIGAG